jgi:hypothetical protein
VGFFCAEIAALQEQCSTSIVSENKNRAILSPTQTLGINTVLLHSRMAAID